MEVGMSGPKYEVTSSGLATLGPDLVGLRAALEGRFLAWAAEIGASPMLFPALIRADRLARLDYFRNFPHLAVVASRIRPDRLEAYAQGGASAAVGLDGIPGGDLVDGRYVLPSAACYGIYLHLEDTVLAAPRYITTFATSCRNEETYAELPRLWR